ncbi:MAG: hypothetical protein OQL08_02155 [Gammaproteobacteria bacterium]|nr:hypothetical protein [Gammaproteobacteria bacterium]
MTQDTSLTEKQKFWLGQVQACARSGQSMRVYAEANGLSAFNAWKKTLRRKGNPPIFVTLLAYC